MASSCFNSIPPPPATSFFRVHKPSKFDDDLSGFRKTVVEANRGKKVISGLEVGRAGPGLRMVYPLFYENRHLGSVEFGAGLKASLAIAQNTIKAGFAIGILESVFKAAKRFKGLDTDIQREEIIYYSFSSDDIHDVMTTMEKDASPGWIKAGERTFYLHEFSLTDYSDTSVGRMMVFQELTDTLSTLKRTTLKFGLTIFGVLVIISIVVLHQFRSIRANLEEKLNQRRREVEEKTQAFNRIMANFSDFDQLKQGFVARVASGIQAPLLSMQGYWEEIKPKLQLQEIEPIQILMDRNHRLLTVVDQLRELESIRLNQNGAWNDALVPAAKLIGQVESDCQRHLTPHVTLSLELPENTPPMRLDAERMQMALTTLLKFVIHRTRHGIIRLIVAAKDDRWIEIHIQSEQMDLPPNEAQSLFQEPDHVLRFLEAGQSLEEHHLELSISQAIVIHYGGQITVKSATPQFQSPGGIEIRLPVLDRR